MSSLVNLFPRELWRAWIKLQEVDHSKRERRANLIFPVSLSLGAASGFGGAETPPAPTQMLKQLTFPTSYPHSMWGTSPIGSVLWVSYRFWRVLVGWIVQAHSRETGYKRNIKQESFGGLVLFIILWNICFVSKVVTGWILLWCTIAIPICVPARAEGWWWRLSRSLCTLFLPGTDTSSKTFQFDWQIYPISAHKTALKAAVPWECQYVWIYEAALNKGLQMLLLRSKS